MKFVILLPLVTIITGCASTQYSAWEGDGIREGSGGVRKNHSGVDFWITGEPNQPYQIIGVIEDERSSGLIQQAIYRDNIASKVREVGGDGVVRKARDENVEFMSGDDIFSDVTTVLYVIEYQ